MSEAGGTDAAVRVPVDAGDHRYEVIIGAGALAELPDVARTAGKRGSGRVFLVCDAGLPDGLVARAHEPLCARGLRVSRIDVEASEARKSLATLAEVLRRLAETGHERGDVVVALGGGIVGDVGGFAAAVYRRGVPVVQCPTTLLAMVDASVGGKTGVNIEIATPGGGHALLKNMAGAFHQPVAVIADTSALASLDARTYRAGLAECVKHALLGGTWGDPDLFEWMESSCGEILAREPVVVRELIARNVRIKAAVVGADERERAEGARSRATLNLGHTFAHALETNPALRPDETSTSAPLLHGEAVALGLVAACRVSAELKLADRSLEARTRQLLTSLGLPTRVRDLPPAEAVLERMRHDKKVSGGQVRLVVALEGGRCDVVKGVAEGVVAAGLEAIRI